MPQRSFYACYLQDYVQVLTVLFHRRKWLCCFTLGIPFTDFLLPGPHLALVRIWRGLQNVDGWTSYIYRWTSHHPRLRAAWKYDELPWHAPNAFQFWARPSWSRWMQRRSQICCGSDCHQHFEQGKLQQTLDKVRFVDRISTLYFSKCFQQLL